MGKKGAAMRAAKAQSVIRTFTEEQLRDRDQALLIKYRKQAKKEMDEYMASEKKRMWALIEEEWARRVNLLAANDGTPGGFHTVLNLLLSTSCRVLIEHFGWPSLARTANRRYRTTRFCELLVEEINKITSDEYMDIRSYNDDTLRMYGIKFYMEDGKDEES